MLRLPLSLAFSSLLMILVPPVLGQGSSQAAGSADAASRRAGPQQAFLAGEAALNGGNLDLAEREFRKVLAIDPQSAGAYANLGVIYMRRKKWDEALLMLHKADRLAPTVAGIRLNIGLAYFRQNDFRSAIAPFESVVRDQPSSTQARYLLGLSYFFTDQWAEAVDTLEPLWGQQSLNISYLYVLANAAHKAGRTQVDERASSRLAEIGQDTPQFHLIMGKAHLNNQQYEQAIQEFQSAAKGDPKLPFLHFNLGLAYLNQQDYERAAQEFQQDIRLEPDVAYDYDRLGTVLELQQKNEEAEKDFEHALRLDPRLTSSWLGLAKIYQGQGKYSQALAALDSALKVDPDNYGPHYLRGQVLRQMGQREEAKVEFDIYTRMMNAARAKRGKELSGEIPNPELMVEPQ